LPRPRPALDVTLLRPDRTTTATLDALLDDYRPFAIDERPPATRRVFFFTGESRDAAAAALARTLGAGVDVEAIDLDDDGWAERAQASLQAIRVGSIIVTPPWDRAPVGPTDTEVVIRPAMGFGTGHHASTRLCLRALQGVALEGRPALDLGAGSGVLAIAAAKLGATPVVGIEPDPDALRNAAENLTLNKLTDEVELRKQGLDISVPGAPFAVVIANLTGTLLTDRAMRIRELVADDGVLILGGIEATEAPTVVEAFETVGVTMVDRAEEDGWVGMTLRPHREPEASNLDPLGALPLLRP
jgi:ribosomal protein L11 methyltransferase